MTNTELRDKLKDIEKNYKTLYVMGCFGAPLNAKNKDRYKKNHSYNMKPERQTLIQNASADTFGFDCVCLIKGILWGWNGDTSKVYGGAVYTSNNVPDIGTEQIINLCSEVSTDFNKISVGELVWMQGHVGVYIGDGLVIECSPKWENRVQVSGLVGKQSYTSHTRTWTKHGKLPWIEYNYNGDESGLNNSTNTTTVEISTEKICEETQERYIWNTLYKAINNEYGVAGLMGNLYAESGLKANNLQNSFEKKLGLDDIAYTAAVDNDLYTNFIKDGAGYGLAQWTYWSRKQNLLNYAKSLGKSIGNLPMQLDFLINELQGYKTVWNTLKSATSIKEASDIVLTQFERPADQSDNAKNKRAGYGETFYDLLAGQVNDIKQTATTETTVQTNEIVYIVRVGDNLTNIAKRYNTTINKLVQDNNIKNPNLIYVGQKIRII